MYLELYQTVETPPLKMIDQRAARGDRRRLPTKAKNTGTRRAGVPIDPKACQMSTTERKNRAQAIASTVELVRKKGKICAIGLTGGKTVEFPWEKAAFRVADVHFCLSTSYTSWDRAIHLIATGQIPAGQVITHRLPLDEWEKAFEEIEALRALKVILHP